MPLFLKNIAPELDIFGNRQLFNFNKEPSSGESDSAFTLINWFTPITNVNANSTFEFLTPTLKGFRFNHSLSTTGTFGNFSFQKYDRFGNVVDIFKYDETLDTLNFLKPISISGNNVNPIASLTGAVTGAVVKNGDTSIPTSLNMTQLLSSSKFSLKYPTQTYLVSECTTQYDPTNLTNSARFFQTFSATSSNNEYRSWDIESNVGCVDNSDTGYFAISQTLPNMPLIRPFVLTKQNNVVHKYDIKLTGDVKINGTVDANSNNIYSSGQINATYGTLKGNNLATHSSPSIVVTNHLAMSSNAITGLANPTNNQDAATKQYVDINSPTAQSIMHGYLFNSQSTNIATGDHIKFDNSAFTRGTSITLDTSSTYSNAANTASIGRITLAAGKTYKLTAIACTASFSSTSAYLNLKWHNNTTNTALGTVNTWWGGGFNYTSGGAVVAYITTTVSTRVELRINNVSALTQLYGTSDSNSATWFVVEEV